MSGFVYIWMDRKHNRFYIGSHWGSLDDGYICSSSWMMNAISQRPDDFRRRIIAVVNTTIKELQLEEQRWLDMINIDEIGIRYYNLKKHAAGGHGGANRGVKRSLAVREQVAKKLRGRKRPEVAEKVSAILKGRALSQSHRDALKGPRPHTRVPKPVVECPHCGKTGGRGAMSKWHFDRCDEVLRMLKGKAE